jgi:hypothetical protein
MFIYEQTLSPLPYYEHPRYRHYMRVYIIMNVLSEHPLSYKTHNIPPFVKLSLS